MTDQTSQNAILTAARELFTSRGFASTSVREICESAGVTPPALYYYFGSKEGLFEAVVEETLQLDDFCRQLREAVEAAADPWDKLRVYVHTYLTRFPAHLLNPGLHLQDSTQLDDISLRRLEAGISDIYRLTQDLLGEGIASGQFRDVDVSLVASCLLGLVDSFVRARVYLGVDYAIEQIEDRVVDLLSHGLSSRSAGQVREIAK